MKKIILVLLLISASGPSFSQDVPKPLESLKQKLTASLLRFSRSIDEMDAAGLRFKSISSEDDSCPLLRAEYLREAHEYNDAFSELTRNISHFERDLKGLKNNLSKQDVEGLGRFLKSTQEEKDAIHRRFTFVRLKLCSGAKTETAQKSTP